MKKISFILLFLFVVNVSLIAAKEPNANQMLIKKELIKKYNNKINIHWNANNNSPEIIIFKTPFTINNNHEITLHTLIADICKMNEYNKNVDSLILSEIRNHNGRKFYKYTQIYKGIRVKNGGYVITTQRNGDIQSVLGYSHNNISCENIPKITITKIDQIIINKLYDEDLKVDSVITKELIIYPSDNEVYFLAFEITLLDKWNDSWNIIINAITGEIIEKKRNGMSSSGNVFEKHPGIYNKHITVNPLNNIDYSGYLQGTYVVVEDGKTAEAYNEFSIFPYLPFEDHFDEVNLYYHVDRIATYFNDLGFDEFTQITAIAAYPYATPRAEYDPATHEIRLYDEEDEEFEDYNNHALEDKIIYHEYTHAVTHYVSGISYGLTESGAIHEGNSDYFSGSITNRNLICEYACEGDDSKWRDMEEPRIENYTQYDIQQYYSPYPLHEQHCGGELWSACLWNIRDELGASITDEIVLDGLYSLSGSPTFLQYRQAIVDADYPGVNRNIIKHIFYLREIGTDGEIVTTSGEIQQNETWDSTQVLRDDVTVPQGVTLTLNSTSIINMNGKKVTSTGGTIIVNGAQLIPDVRLMNGTSIEGLYPTISSAFSDGSVVKVSDEYTSVVDISIGDGKILIPQSGSELKFASGKYLEIESGGNLTANGSAFTGTSGIWGGIKYNSGSTGSLTNCTISNATCGVYLNSGRNITNCTITTDGNYNYGIYINSASPTILDCNITGSEFFSTSNVSYGIYSCGGTPYIIDNTIDATYGIYNYSSSPYVKNNNVTSELVGLYCENSSPYLAEYADHGHNDFQGSYSECGVWATNGSHPVLGTQDCGWGENKFVYNDVEALAYAETGSSIYAKYNWWSSSAPSSSLFIGDVTYLPCLASSPVFSPQAPSPENNLYDTRMMLAGAIPDSVEEGSEDLLRYYNDQWDLEKKIGFLRYLYMLGEAKGLTDVCKDIIEENPYQPEAFTALDLIYQIVKNEKVKKDFDKEMLKTYLKTFEDSRSNPLLKANAMLMLAGVEKDVARMDEVYAANMNTYMGKHALRKKFMYYFHDEADLKLARDVLNEMDEVYPNEAVTYESHVLIGDEVMDPKEFYSQYFKKDAPKQIQIASTGIDEIIPKEYALNPAFPNPFNPSTALEFALPVQSHVECSIYDLAGNLIKEYSYNQNAGNYSIVWNASNVSSSIYLIRFVAEAEDGSETFVDYQKVTLLK